MAPEDAGSVRPKRRRPTREERLEAELRANLKRRKDQSRARAAGQPGPPDDGGDGASNDGAGNDGVVNDGVVRDGDGE